MRALYVAAMFACIAAAQQPQPAQYTIAGTVVDHLSGRPLAGILMSVALVAGDSEPIGVLTAADGRFSFTNLPAGKYGLSAERRGGRPQQYLQHGPYSTAIVTGPGLDSQHITFSLAMPAHLSGVVLDSDGDPVPDAQVSLLRQDYSNGFLRFFQTHMTGTSKSGAFHFSDLQPSRYYIAVQGHPWYAQHPNLMSGAPEPAGIPPELDVAYPITYSGDTTDPAAAQPLQLNEGAMAEIHITLHPVPAVSLILKFSDEESRRINAFLTTRGLGGIAFRDNQGMMGRPGAEQVSGVAPGRYELTSYGGSERIRRTVDLTANTTIEISNEDPVQDTGHVTLDPPGSGPSRLMIVLESEGGAVYVGRPAADGALSFSPAVPAGHYQVSLNHSPDFYIKSISLNGVKAPGDFIDIPASGGFDISVIASRVAVDKLEGVVEHDGKPVPAAMVLLIPDDLSRAGLIRRDQSDSDGSFSLPEVAPGRYTLLALSGDPDFAYRDPVAIKPYLAHGQPVTVSSGFSQRMKVSAIDKK